MNASAVFRLIWLAGGLALLLGLARDPWLGLLPPPRELPRADGATGRAWVSGEFRPVAGLQEIDRGVLPGHLQQATSWIGSDSAQGRAETAWFRPSREVVHVGVAGYPQRPGIRLWAEFRSAAGTIARVDCRLPDPRETWQVWSFDRPAEAIAVRLIAEDRSSATFGWIAFTHPYRVWLSSAPAIYQHVQVYATVALALTLLWGPGLLLLRRETPAEMRAVVLLAAGPLTLAAIGVAIWIAGGLVSPRVLGFTGVAGLWISLGVVGARKGFEPAVSATMRRVLAVTALVVIAVAAKSTYSVGPEGETFRGTVSRNLAAGDRLDSRYSFYVVQAIAGHFAPHDPTVEKLFYPWTFFSRGPLAGLAAAPVVLATGGRPPASVPDQRWSPFDREGFAAYRLTLIALASGIVLAGFLLLAPFLGEAWALAAVGLLALSPFGVHEIMFTWPKWIATAWLVTSFGFVHARRPAAAGLVLGIGFLYHPLVLLWSPWLALWAAGRAGPTPKPIVLTLGRFAGGAGLLVLPWMLLGTIAPHLPDTPFAGQGGFFRYFQLADSNLGTWPQWFEARWLNFANTFLPLHLVASDASFHHFRLNSTYEPSGPLVKAAFVWWNTLPFGLGLGLWTLVLAAAPSVWRSFRAAAILLLVGPAALLVVYWGMDPLGLMRECGHPLLLAIIALLCVTAAQRGGWPARILGHRALPWIQLPETLLMLWLTTLLNPRPWAVDHADLDAPALGINLAALAATAWLLSRHRPSLAVPPSPSA